MSPQRTTRRPRVSVLIALGILCLSAHVQAEEQSGNVIGIKQPRGSTLNIVPWLDFPATKTSAALEWRGAPDTPTLAAVLFDGKKVTFEDDNFFMMMVGVGMDYQNSLCRSTLLRLLKGVNFPANSADISAEDGGAWIRLIHGAVAGGSNVKVVYAADQSKNEKPLEIRLPAAEAFDTYKQLIESGNANARQSGILALRWWAIEKNRKEISEHLNKALQDSYIGVRGAAAWVIGQLQLKESSSALKEALKTEASTRIKATMESGLKKFR